MEKRWNVYHGSDYLGLKTAKEIREALRRGSLDPFDRVSIEGSNIREDLIDVDEIFRESTGHFAEDPNGTIVADRPMAVGERSSREHTPSPAPSFAPAAASSSQNWRPESSAMRLKEDMAQPDALKTPSKRYYIIDREKVLGPLAAHEIQSLYNRGVLNKKVKVQKIGSQRTMSIGQFISSYSGDRMKELVEDGKIPQQIGVGSPSSKVLTELARMAGSRRVSQQRQQKTIVLVSAIVLLVGLVIYLVVQQSRGPSRSNAPRAASEANRQTESVQRVRPRLIQKAPSAPAPAAAPSSEPSEPKATSRKEAPRTVVKPLPTTPKKVAREVAAPPARAPEKPRPSASKKVAAAPPPPQPSTPPPQNQEPAREAPPPSPAPTASGGPIARAIAGAGRIQTVGPLTFQAAALEECASKCNLSMRDANGANMRVVFFKNAYYDALKVRSKGVTLTGSTKMERGELTLIIQDLR